MTTQKRKYIIKPYIYIYNYIILLYQSGHIMDFLAVYDDRRDAITSKLNIKKMKKKKYIHCMFQVIICGH